MEKYISIHCHFYQPARENPWLETIEVQESAYPFYDWNERITAESYAPNAASRILDEAGRIVKIVNNYSRISFNFGATLLGWMENEAPETYEAILEADRESLRIFSGHGSAIAQAHSHIILPLANRRDKETQVSWGMTDFERRFDRQPEGMWLPETAVDVETLEVLAEREIKFTILAQHQANRVRENGSNVWEQVSGARIDPTRPYTVNLPSGKSIAVFFYDGPISRAVAFERLLGRGEDFVNRLVSGFSRREGSQLVHIATDGETYGHHHRHGDMALAWALDYLEKSSTVQLTNYGQYLELHPPAWEAEIAEFTSWSCTHGVERWRSDCGCNSGARPGWKQTWRSPLRNSLDWLRDEIAPRFETEATPLLSDPWQARDDYVSVISNRSEHQIDGFIERQARRELTTSEKTTSLELMELQRYAQLMYTSCGWFFDDISGIETVQVIEYATRVIQLAEKLFGVPLELEFLDRLESAQSNSLEDGNGRQIYLMHGKPGIVDLSKVGAHYAISSLFDDYSERNNIYCYAIDRQDYQSVELGRARAAVGKIAISSEITLESATLTVGVLYMGDLSVSGGIRIHTRDEDYQALVADFNAAVSSGDLAAMVRMLDKHFGEQTFSMRSLFRDEQKRILNQVWNSGIAEAEAAYKQLYEEHRGVMLFQSDMKIALPRIFRLTAEVSLNLSLRRAAEEEEVPLLLVQRLLNETRRFNIPLDEGPLSYRFQHMAEKHARAFQLEPEDPRLLEQLDEAVTLVGLLPFEVHLWKVQNAYYRVRHTLLPDLLVRSGDGDEEATEWVEQFRALGEKLTFGEI